MSEHPATVPRAREGQPVGGAPRRPVAYLCDSTAPELGKRHPRWTWQLEPR